MLKTPLRVIRTLSDGKRIFVGQLAENAKGIFFQYSNEYLDRHSSSLAPFNLKFDASLQKAPKEPHYSLHGVFADSLPDGWGLYLMDRVFREHGKNPQQITALERLAFVGNRCLGALSYEPEIQFEQDKEEIDFFTLADEALKEFEGAPSDFIDLLMNAGGSGGARPKVNVTLLDSGEYSTAQDAKGKKLLVKLTSEKFALKHFESLIEYIYMGIAQKAKIEVPEFKLVDANDGRFWLQQTRFDCSPKGRFHMISASGLLDASFREPSLDYVDLTKATRLLCGIDEAKKLVKRALFNFALVNQDDHAKNFAFLADDNDKWRLSPFYDLVYTPTSFQEHMTAFNGNGKYPTIKALKELAGQTGFSSIKPLVQMLEEVFEVAQCFSTEAKNLGVPKAMIKNIASHIEEKRVIFSNQIKNK